MLALGECVLKSIIIICHKALNTFPSGNTKLFQSWLYKSTLQLLNLRTSLTTRNSAFSAFAKADTSSNHITWLSL